MQEVRHLSYQPCILLPVTSQFCPQGQEFLPLGKIFSIKVAEIFVGTISSLFFFGMPADGIEDDQCQHNVSVPTGVLV